MSAAGRDELVKLVDKDQRSALAFACDYGWGELVYLILNNVGPTTAHYLVTLVDNKEEQRWSPLHWACRRGHIYVAQLLLDIADKVGGGSVTANYLVTLGDKNQQTALHLACSDVPLFRGEGSSPTELTQLLLDSAEDVYALVNRVDKDGHSALHYACQHGHTEIAQLLRKYKRKK